MEKFSESDRKSLLSNRYVSTVTKNHVTFTSSFKIKAVELNLKGKSPLDIFLSLGVDPSFFVPNYPKKSISRWKKLYLEEGRDALKKDRRGTKSKGRPRRKYDPEDIDSIMGRLAYLEAENDFLKKLHALADSKEKKSTR
jgi:transposase